MVLVLFVVRLKKMSEEEPKKTEKQLIRQAEKERKKKEKLEKELKKKREGVVSSSGGGGSVVTVHASQTPPVNLDAVSGTRDFFPEEFRLQTWLFEKFRKCGLRAGFEEYDAPVLERQELYKRKAGEEITQQMYSFVDKDGVEVTLRPEMTPTLARMVLSRGASMILPLKWFSIPQCWRFEATQRGRKREHYQWNMDIIGCKEITAEVELLSAAVEFFKSCGITSADVGIKVNSRKVMQSMLTINDVPDEIFAPTCVILDKLDKIGAEAVVKELTETLGLPRETAENVVKTLSCKTVEELEEMAREAIEVSSGGDDGDNTNSNTKAVDDSSIRELKELFKLAEEYGFGDWLQFDASVVRGLAYYTGVVFEAFDKAGELRAIAGGGRYDKLLSLYGATTPVPACGFGFGDCVIVELLKEKNLLPNVQKRVDFCVCAYNKDMQEDKESLFDSVDTVLDTMNILVAMLPTCSFNREHMRTAAQANFALATDYADYLTKKNVPFREAHSAVGNMVSFCERQNKTLAELTLKELRDIHPEFDEGALEITIEYSLNARSATGGTAPGTVQAARKSAQIRLNEEATQE